MQLTIDVKQLSFNVLANLHDMSWHAYHRVKPEDLETFNGISLLQDEIQRRGITRAIIRDANGQYVSAWVAVESKIAWIQKPYAIRTVLNAQA